MGEIGDFILDNFGKLFLLTIFIIIMTSYIRFKYTSESDRWRVIKSLKGHDKGYYYAERKIWFLLSWWTIEEENNTDVKFGTSSQASYFIDKIREKERIQDEEDKMDDYKIIPYGAKEENKK